MWNASAAGACTHTMVSFAPHPGSGSVQCLSVSPASDRNSMSAQSGRISPSSISEAVFTSSIMVVALAGAPRTLTLERNAYSVPPAVSFQVSARYVLSFFAPPKTYAVSFTVTMECSKRSSGGPAPYTDGERGIGGCTATVPLCSVALPSVTTIAYSPGAAKVSATVTTPPSRVPSTCTSPSPDTATSSSSASAAGRWTIALPTLSWAWMRNWAGRPASAAASAAPVTAVNSGAMGPGTTVTASRATRDAPMSRVRVASPTFVGV
mmetsp:Transcript_10531/g.21923  ORF Transcript_10531/g.21923 Transcript_10531/m.21923 type:complete len:265 (+) Transcript_10531:724-1518(+)